MCFSVNIENKQNCSWLQRGRQTTCLKYQPISLPTVISKVLEKLFFGEMISSVKFSNSNSQHGFRQKRSTVTNLIEYILEVYTYHDKIETKYLACLYLDFQKAFDKLNHAMIIIEKIRSFGYTGQSLKLLKNYLTDREQTVCLGQAVSEPLPVHSGVPQGSILGKCVKNQNSQCERKCKSWSNWNYSWRNSRNERFFIL